jgi:hypothetical protein
MTDDEIRKWLDEHRHLSRRRKLAFNQGQPRIRRGRRGGPAGARSNRDSGA